MKSHVHILLFLAMLFSGIGAFAQFDTETSDSLENQILYNRTKTYGIKLNDEVDTTGIVYMCDNEEIVTLVGENAGSDYNLTVTVTSGTTPVSKMGSEGIIKNVIGGSTLKIFKL